MSRLRRYETFEDLKADRKNAAVKPSLQKEKELKNFFENIRKYKITKRDSSNNNSKLHGG